MTKSKKPKKQTEEETPIIEGSTAEPRGEKELTLDELLGEPGLTFRVTGFTSTEDFYIVDKDAKEVRVSNKIGKKGDKYSYLFFEDGGGLVNRINRSNVRVYHILPERFSKVLEKIPNTQIIISDPGKKKTSKQSKELLRSYAKFGAGDKKGFGISKGVDMGINADETIPLKTIPDTAYYLALEISKMYADKSIPIKDNYVKLPSVRALSMSSGVLINNERHLLQWLRRMDRIQIPLITKDGDDRIIIENHKLCQIKFYYRNNTTGELEDGIKTDDPKTTRYKLEEVWVKIGDKILDNIDNPPKGFGYVIMPDDFSFLLQTLKNQLTRKLCSYIFSQREELKLNEDNLIEELGLVEARKKQGLQKIQKNLKESFEELCTEGFLCNWSRDTGAGGQIVYKWTREDYGGSSKKKQIEKGS